MTTDSEISAIRASLYECALGQAEWASTLARAGALVGAHSGLLALPTYNAEAGYLIDAIEWNVDAAAAASLARELGLDPWSRVIAARNLAVPGAAFVGGELCSRAAVMASPWWDAFLREAGNADMMAMAFKAPPQIDAGVCTLAFHRGPKDEPFGARELSLLGALRDDIERACQMTFLLRATQRTAQAAQTLLSAMAEPAFILDGEARILALNPAAETVLREENVLKLSQGRVSAIASSAGFGAALDAAAQGRAANVLLKDRAGATRRLTLSPLPERARQAGALANAQMLGLMEAPAALRALSADQLARQFGLTPAEADVAARLAQGRSPRQIALARGVAIDTVRHQIKSLFAKLGVSRQTEAVALLARHSQRAASLAE